jgi:hypothetical protein
MLKLRRRRPTFPHHTLVAVVAPAELVGFGTDVASHGAKACTVP